MLRFLSRFIGLWLLAGALVALVVDGARTISAGEIVVTPVSEFWLHLAPDSFAAARSAVEAHAVSWLWDPVVLWLLQIPAFVLLAGLGALLLWAGQKPRPIIPELELR